MISMSQAPQLKTVSPGPRISMAPRGLKAKFCKLRPVQGATLVVFPSFGEEAPKAQAAPSIDQRLPQATHATDAFELPKKA